MNFGYLIYQAERPVSQAEQHASDARMGELAAGLSRLSRRVRSRRAAPAAPVAPTAEASHAGPASLAADIPAVPDCACALIMNEPNCAPAR